MTVDIRHYIPVRVTRTHVAVGNESYACDVNLGDMITAIGWYPEGVSDTDKRRGVAQRAGEPPEIFDDFSALEPHLAAWQAAKDRATEAAARAKAEAEAQQKAALEAQAAAEAANKDRQKLYDALDVLGRTDHELFKALEAIPAVRERLDPTWLEQREEARLVARMEKSRLGL